MKLLVFPIDCEDDSTPFELLDQMGIQILGASSCLRKRFLGRDVAWLPFVSDEGFLQALGNMVTTEGITHIYTSHAGVWGVLDSNCKSKGSMLPIELCSEFPFKKTWRAFERYLKWGGEVFERCHPQAILSVDQLSSFYYQFTSIPGQSDGAKLEALTWLAPDVPEGDWVEIGALYGRSSFALGHLAAIYTDDNLVSIDPWDIMKIKPQKGNAKILDGQALNIDVSKIFSIFRASISLLSNVTYIQGMSEEGISRYLASDLDGRPLKLKNKIALLHIDGNHHFDEVSKDIRLWEPLVVEGGWIAIDDYLWAFGDGPKRAGDDLLATGRFDVAYVSGDTLYMRKAKHA